MRNGDAECVAVRDKQSELAVTSRRVHGGLPQMVTGNRSMKIRNIGGNGDKCALNTGGDGDKQPELAVTDPVHGSQTPVATGNRSMKIRDIGGNDDDCAVNTSDLGDETQSEPAAANPPVDVDRSKVDTINLWNCMYASFN